MQYNNLIKTVQANNSRFAMALAASANSGKTAILKLFVDEFRHQRVPIIDMAPMGSNGIDEMWCFKKDGVIVGIATGGDDAAMIDTAFDFFKKNNCQLVFCATRYYANTVSWGQFETRCKADGYQYNWVAPNHCSPATIDIIHRDVVANVLLPML